MFYVLLSQTAVQVSAEEVLLVHTAYTTDIAALNKHFFLLLTHTAGKPVANLRVTTAS